MTRPAFVLLIMLATWVAAGVIEPLLYSASQLFNPAALVHTLMLAVLLMVWVHYHAVAMNMVVSVRILLFVGIVPVLGLPYYLFSRFGFRAGGKKLLLGLLFLFLCVLAYVASMEFVYMVS